MFGQAAGQGRHLQQFRLWIDHPGGGKRRLASISEKHRISKSGLRGFRKRLRRSRLCGEETERAPLGKYLTGILKEGTLRIDPRLGFRGAFPRTLAARRLDPG